MAAINMKLSPPVIGHDFQSDKTHWATYCNDAPTIGPKTKSKTFVVLRRLIELNLNSLELFSQFDRICNWLKWMDMCIETIGRHTSLPNSPFMELLSIGHYVCSLSDNYINSYISFCIFVLFDIRPRVKIPKRRGLKTVQRLKKPSLGKDLLAINGIYQLKRFPPNCNKWNRMWSFWKNCYWKENT